MKTQDPPILRNSALATPVVVLAVALVRGPWEAVGTLVGSAVVLGNLWVLSILGPRLISALANERDPTVWMASLLAKFVLLIGLFLLLFKVLPAFGLMLGFVSLMLGTLATGLELAIREQAGESAGDGDPAGSHPTGKESET